MCFESRSLLRKINFSKSKTMHPFMQKSLQMLLENHWLVKSAIRYMYALGKTGTQQRIYYSLSHYLMLLMYTVVYLFRNFTKIYT